MLLTSPLAAYLTRAAEALENAETRAALLDAYPHLGDECTECGTVIDRWDEQGGHVLFETAERDVIVVVGCEGYWMVNPNELGIPAPDWDDASVYGGPTEDEVLDGIGDHLDAVARPSADDAVTVERVTFAATVLDATPSLDAAAATVRWSDGVETTTDAFADLGGVLDGFARRDLSASTTITVHLATSVVEMQS
jgi:hypothetical protein